MAVEEALRLLGREWYEKVTAEEIVAIKKAMVNASGTLGIMTHSGHWYNCANGHPVSYVLCSFHFPRHYISSLMNFSYVDFLFCFYGQTD